MTINNCPIMTSFDRLKRHLFDGHFRMHRKIFNFLETIPILGNNYAGKIIQTNFMSISFLELFPKIDKTAGKPIILELVEFLFY